MGRNHSIGALLGLASLFVSSAALGQAAEAGSSGASGWRWLAVLRRPALGSGRQ